MQTSDLQFEFLSSYLAELSLLDYNCVKFLPSLVAASVVFLARFMSNPKTHPWVMLLSSTLYAEYSMWRKLLNYMMFCLQNSALHQLTRYKPSDLKECVLNIHDLYLSKRGGSLQAVREKYKQHKVISVAFFLFSAFIIDWM